MEIRLKILERLSLTSLKADTGLWILENHRNLITVPDQNL